MACDHRYIILDVCAKWPGAAHDSRIFLNSGLREMFERGKFHEVYRGVSSHVFCHTVGLVIYLWMLGLNSKSGVRQSCTSVLLAILAALSARSLTGMPTWPGSHHRYMSKSDAVSLAYIYMFGLYIYILKYSITRIMS